MKTMIATILTIALILTACPMIATAEETVSVLAVVIAWEEYDADTWMITCMTADEDAWMFYCDAHDYSIGSMVKLTIWMEGLEVIDAENCGYLMPCEMTAFFR